MLIVIVLAANVDEARLDVGNPQVGAARVVDHTHGLLRSAKLHGAVVLRILVVIDNHGGKSVWGC